MQAPYKLERSRMKNSIQLCGIAVSALMTCLLADKGLELHVLGQEVDGNGIGVSFLGVEVNDRVTEKAIPSYAAGFVAVSCMTAAAVLLLTAQAIREYKKT